MAKHAARELLNLPLDDAFQRFTSTPERESPKSRRLRCGGSSRPRLSSPRLETFADVTAGRAKLVN